MRAFKKIIFIAILAVSLPGHSFGEAKAEGTKATQIITAEQIENQAHQYLIEHLPWNANQVEIVMKYHGGDLELPAGKVQYDYSLPASLNRAGRIPVVLRVQGESGPQRQLRLTAFVDLYQDVVKLKKAMRRGELLKADDLEMDQVKTSQPIRGAIGRIEDAVDFEVIRNLDSGNILTLDLLKKPFVINRGDHILIVAEKEGMKITASGVAKENGAQGSVISVENVQTKKVIYGQVVDQNSVKINF